MKMFAFIMAIVILAISGLPCTDSAFVVKDDKAKTEISKVPGQDNNEHQDADGCPPLCTCSCCSASTCYPPQFKLQADALLFQLEKYPLVNIAFHNEVFSSIWQPPKVS